MNTPDYVSILKLDKLALKSQTQSAFLLEVRSRLHIAERMGVGSSFPYFVDQAWSKFGNGK